MSGRRLNLCLPNSSQYSLEKSSLERPSSRTDKLVDASFSSDIPQEGNEPKLIASSSYKTLKSVGKLKDLMQKTSEKLKSISRRTSQTPGIPLLPNNQNKNDSYRTSQLDSPDKASELLKLRREVRILEMEKKELENTNKKLQDSLYTHKESLTMSEDGNIDLQRYGKFILTAVKDDPIAFGAFKDIFGSEEGFLMKINSENLSSLSLGMMQFVLEVLGRPARYSAGGISNQNTISPRSPFMNKPSNDAYSRIYAETQNISESIMAHKQKIQRIADNVKETVNISRNMSATPTISRPHSSASASNEYRGDANSLRLFLKQKEKV
ncbi:hypothetical protein SteCoe_37038 [Stentor coeruleus]|uniref:Uncharacterized protein n=1 Tax=Stentor coeruleus TaxID=5963 RepID=A0A1R2ANZ2_9CILI|nr:hypothetical protein SteCoe_37038 [Stentor coeruleus]